jgi:uncharacterized membrane protein YfcA
MILEPWQWMLLVVGAVMVGMAKTGLPGLGTLFIAIFANVLPTKEATGLVLPLLILGDIVAVLVYRRHAVWSQLWGLFPWAGLGIVLGYFAMDRIDNHQARVLVGSIVLALLTIHAVRRWRERRAGTASGGSAPVAGGPRVPRPVVASVGVLAGFTTLIANAAGPLMAIYLLALRLPKLEFIGTSAVYFLLLNLFKVPFMAHLGLINGASLWVNLLLAPAVWTGALVGRLLVQRINQRWFEILTLSLTGVAGLRLLLS